MFLLEGCQFLLPFFPLSTLSSIWFSFFDFHKLTAVDVYYYLLAINHHSLQHQFCECLSRSEKCMVAVDHSNSHH